MLTAFPCSQSSPATATASCWVSGIIYLCAVTSLCFSLSLVQDINLQYKLEHKNSEFGANTDPVLSDSFLKFRRKTQHEFFPCFHFLCAFLSHWQQCLMSNCSALDQKSKSNLTVKLLLHKVSSRTILSATFLCWAQIVFNPKLGLAISFWNLQQINATCSRTKTRAQKNTKKNWSPHFELWEN